MVRLSRRMVTMMPRAVSAPPSSPLVWRVGEVVRESWSQMGVEQLGPGRKINDQY